jgi:hypothetical protein
LHPIDGCTISIEAIPPIILTGQSVSRDREAFYLALLDHPKCPKLTPQDAESLSAFTTRVFAAIAADHSNVPFTIEMLPNGDMQSEYGDAVETLPDNIINAIFRVGNPSVINIQPFDEAVKKHNPLLAASLIGNLGRSSQWTFDMITPLTAMELGEIHYFSGDGGEWFEYLRDEAARELQQSAADEQPQKEAEVTNKQLRAYIRSAGVRTPGAVRRMIGAHYARIYKNDGLRLSPEKCKKRIAALPPAEKALAIEFLEGEASLRRIGHALKRQLTQEDYEILRSGNESYPQIGLVLENDVENQIVTETVDEVYQYMMQDEGFGPNYAIVIHAEKKSINRFFRVLDLMQKATASMERLVEQICSYNGEP